MKAQPTMNAAEEVKWAANVRRGNIHGYELRFEHGRSAFIHWICRCAVCHEAAKAYARENYARRKDIILARRRELREGDKQWK